VIVMINWLLKIKHQLYNKTTQQMDYQVMKKTHRLNAY